MKASPGPRRRIDANSFDPDHFADRAAADVPLFNAWCQHRGLDVRFVATRRHLVVFETSPGGFQLAKHDRGWVGAYLRKLEADGWTSKTPAVIEALECRNNAEANTARRAELRAARHTSLIADIDRLERSQNCTYELILQGDALIDAAVRANSEWRDFATLWPKRNGAGIPIPIADPHQVKVRD